MGAYLLSAVLTLEHLVFLLILRVEAISVPVSELRCKSNKEVLLGLFFVIHHFVLLRLHAH